MKKILAVLLVAVLCIGLLAGCANKKSDQTQTDNSTVEKEAGNNTVSTDTIKVGNIQDTSGVTSAQGLSVQRGIEMCISEINAAGGINGKSIELISYDCAGDAEEALNCYKRLCEVDQVSVILGPPLSNVGLACIEITNQYKVPFLGAFAINDCMVNPKTGETYKYMFAVQPTAEYAGRILAEYVANELGYKKIAVMSRSDQAYLNASYLSFLETAKSNGIKIVSDQTVSSADTDYKVQILNMLNTDAEMIVHFLETNDNVLFFNQYNQLGGTLEVGGGTSFAQPMVSMLDSPSYATGLYFTNNLDLNDPKLEGIAERYKNTYGTEADVKTFVGYDLGLVLEQALLTAEDDSSEAITKALENNIVDIDLCEGTFSFGKDHMPKGLSMVIYKIDNGEYTVIDQYSPED